MTPRSLALVTVLLVGCSDASRTGFTSQAPANDAGASAEPGGGGGPGFSNETADAGPVGDDGCLDAARLVYVLSLEGDLYSFAPADKKFTKVGPLDCGSQLTPISMAVDRKAVAWVNMRAGSFLGGKDQLYKVDTKTAKCTPSSIQGQYGSMGGMGFSTNGSSKEDETLFVVSAGSGLGPGLHKVDFAQEKLSLVADFSEQVDLELTGTGDGRLYGFLIAQPLGLAQIDKSSGGFSDKVTLTGVKAPQAPMFAFSFWGGDFYFYTANSTSPSNTTTVARYRPADGSIDAQYMDQIGFHIVGAGVSTCAPTSAPK